MSNYTKIVDYAAKDLLLTGDPAKAGKGTEIGAEFDAIAAMSATKADTATTPVLNASVFKVGPEAAMPWPSTLRVVDIGARTGLVEYADGTSTTAQNVYFDGTNYRYRVTGTAILDQLEASGNRVYYTAPSGTAGAVATFTERFSISNTGVARVNGNGVRHDGNIFHGRVNSDGTAARLPAGWTSSRVGLGDYQVTHTVATANFSVAAATNSFGSMASAALYTTTTFRISTANHAGTAVDVPFNFTLMLD